MYISQLDTKVKSLHKALCILDLFNDIPYERGVSEIAEAMELPKSTVHNILHTFVQYGLLEYIENTKRYRIGHKAVELGHAYRQTNDLVSIMKPYMDTIANETREHVYLGKRTPDNQVLYLESSAPETSMSISNVIGIKAPLYCTGIGKAILAFSPDSVFEQVVSTDMPKFTVNTIADPEGLAREIQQIRSVGYATDDMEHEFGVKCVAIPLFDPKETLVGAISISGPSLRFPKYKLEEYAVMLQSIAMQIKRHL